MCRIQSSAECQKTVSGSSYERIYDHHYEILKMEEGEAKRAKLSLSNWVLDLMTSDLDYDYVPDINDGEMAESEG